MILYLVSRDVIFDDAFLYYKKDEVGKIKHKRVENRVLIFLHQPTYLHQLLKRKVKGRGPPTNLFSSIVEKQSEGEALPTNLSSSIIEKQVKGGDH